MQAWIIMHDNDGLTVWGLCSTREKADAALRILTTQKHYGEYFSEEWEVDGAYDDLDLPVDEEVNDGA